MFKSLQANGGGDTLSSVIDRGLDAAQLDNVCLGKWSDDIGVDDSGTTKSRNADVDQKDGLEEEVERNPVQDGSGPELNDIEESKDHPVRQQLGVVVLTPGLQGDQGEVTRNDKTGYI